VNVVEFVPGSISGFVYFDQNNDGVRDASEEPLAGVAISLEGTDDFGGNVSRQTDTDDNGFYTFTGLPPGQYVVSEAQPTGQIDGVPIVDGKDTVGSQGGAVSDNDELTIELDEGVDGVENNFAELLGRRLAGNVVASYDSTSGDTSSVMVAGLILDLHMADDQGGVVGTPLRSTSTTMDGSFDFPGLAPDKYAVKIKNPDFLLPPVEDLVAEIETADSLDQQLPLRGLTAEFVDFRFFTTMTPTEDFLFAVAATDGASPEWMVAADSWTDFTQIQLDYTPETKMVHLEVTDGQGEKLGTDVAADDPGVREIGQAEGQHLFLLSEPSSQYPLQPTNPAPASSQSEAEGEGEAASLFVDPGSADTGVAEMMPPAESAEITPTADFVSQAVFATTTLAATTSEAALPVSDSGTPQIDTPAGEDPGNFDLGSDASSSSVAAHQEQGEGEASLTAEQHGTLLEWAVQDFQNSGVTESLAASFAVANEETPATNVDLALDQLLQEDPFNSL
jgi:hypothetical protein